MREVIRHPSLELVGVLTCNPAKAGGDASEYGTDSSPGFIGNIFPYALLSV